MKQIKKALLILLVAALALSLCACDSPGTYSEYILDVDRSGKIVYNAVYLTAVEDPDVDDDGEAETTQEIIEYKRGKYRDEYKELSEKDAMLKNSADSVEYSYKEIDGVVYSGLSL